MTRHAMLVALAQIRSTPDLEDNLARCAHLAAQASQRGARWVLFPENAPFLGRDRDKLQVAEGIDGPIVAAYSKMASTHGIWITVGSFPERSPSPDHTYNTQVMINPTGQVVASYRKIHLFDVDLPDGSSLHESGSILAGDELVTCDVGPDQPGQAPWRVGLSICYDLRFPELYRALQGAEVVTVPAAFTAQTGHEHWHTLLRARAIENQCYVLAPNQWGIHYEGRASYGQSVAYDPWGRLLANAPERDGVQIIELRREDLERVRTRMPCQAHRRLPTALPSASATGE